MLELEVNEVAVNDGSAGDDHPDEVTIDEGAEGPGKVMEAAFFGAIAPDLGDDEGETEEGEGPEGV